MNNLYFNRFTLGVTQMVDIYFLNKDLTELDLVVFQSVLKKIFGVTLLGMIFAKIQFRRCKTDR